MKKLRTRWGVKNNFQLALIFIVFAVTGSLSAYLAKPILTYFGFHRMHFEEAFWFGGLLYLVLYIILILPIYQVLLVTIGSLFGQFRFFWNFVKRFLRFLTFGKLFSK